MRLGACNEKIVIGGNRNDFLDFRDRQLQRTLDGVRKWKKKSIPVFCREVEVCGRIVIQEIVRRYPGNGLGAAEVANYPVELPAGQVSSLIAERLYEQVWRVRLERHVFPEALRISGTKLLIGRLFPIELVSHRVARER